MTLPYANAESFRAALTDLVANAAQTSHHRIDELRSLQPPTAIELPSPDWIHGYAASVADLPTMKHTDANSALDIIKAMLEPMLAGRRKATWDPVRLQWTPH